MSSKYFTSQTKQTELTKLKVDGEIPKWLNGKLIRNGPALFELGNVKFKHWFDGWAMLHGFNIENGEVFYHSKFIKSKEYLENQKDENASVLSWGTPIDPCKSIFGRFFSKFETLATNTNVNIIKIGEKYFTTSDILTINEADISSLDTLGSKYPEKNGAMAAHPSFNRDGSVWNMISPFSPKPVHKVISFTDDGEANIEGRFGTDRVYYTHSFGNTERYFISIEQPLYLSFTDLITSKLRKKSYYECYHWDTEATNILHIFDRNSKSFIHIKTSEKFFFFHTVNSFEEDGKLIIDFCGYRDNKIVDDFYLENLQTKGVSEENKPDFMRLVVDLSTKETTLKKYNFNVELPSINHKFGGINYNYLYGIHSTNESKELSNAILKYDLKENLQTVWKEEDLLPGEPVFVASPNSESEDDGVLLVLCFDKIKQGSCSVVLSAKNMKEIARSYTPNFIPAALHGSFYKK
jgi:carotenoid cleavage dioxygenase-like enzyme